MDYKIQALMIYYEHWGNEQNKIRKVQEGARQFQKLYHEHSFMMGMSCRSYLKRHNRRTMYQILHILLTKCGGGFQPIDMQPCPKGRVDRLMKHTGKLIHGCDALAVDAIVALL